MPKIQLDSYPTAPTAIRLWETFTFTYIYLPTAFADRLKAGLLFCLLLVVLYAFFLARYIAIVSICLVCGPSIVATCPSIPAVRFAFRLCFIRFVLLFIVVLFGEPKQNQGRGLANRKLVQAPPPPFFRNFTAGRPKVALLFLVIW